jgi:phosphoribosylamine--glycine ligase
MICPDGPKVLEFNCRFGDPEAQVVLPLLDSDLVDVIEAVIEDRLDRLSVRWKAASAICVVLASAGYPGESKTGMTIDGLNQAGQVDRVFVFHAGTALSRKKVVANGGRVLGITALGPDLRSARDRVYQAVDKVHFEGMQYRTDIGSRAIK